MVQGELERVEKEIGGIPDDLLDEEMKNLLKQEEEAALKKRKEKK